MTGVRRILWLGSRAVAAAWLAAALLWIHAPGPWTAPIPEEVARVWPRALAEEPGPQSRDGAAQERRPATPVEVGGADVRAGASLLDENGRFPPLTASYHDFGSFAGYARAMQSLGARFVVVQRRRVVGRIDPESGAIAEAGTLPDFSPRARDYSGEPALARAARAARQRFGAGAEVMMLVPRALDAGLFGAIARMLHERGQPAAALREVRAHYQQGPDGAVQLRVESALRQAGGSLSLDLLFDLGALARLRVPEA